MGLDNGEIHAGRGGYTLIELAIGSCIGAFVLMALSAFAFFVMNFFRTINAETLQPVAAREIRDHLYFSLDDGSTAMPTGLGLLAYTHDQVETFELGESVQGNPPKTLSRIHNPVESRFLNGWDGLASNVQNVATLQKLEFRAEGVLHGGITNRLEFPFYLTPTGAATEPAVIDSYDENERLIRQAPGDRGAVL